MLMKTSSLSLTEQLAGRFAERIRNRLLVSGARLAYTFGVPWVRTLAFALGFFSQALVAWYLLAR